MFRSQHQFRYRRMSGIPKSVFEVKLLMTDELVGIGLKFCTEMFIKKNVAFSLIVQILRSDFRDLFEKYLQGVPVIRRRSGYFGRLE